MRNVPHVDKSAFSELLMTEPEPMVNTEMEKLTLEMRLMSHQVEIDRLRVELAQARDNNRKRRWTEKHGSCTKTPRISFSLRLDDAKELAEWMEVAKRTTMKSPPKGAIKFFGMLSKRIERG